MLPAHECLHPQHPAGADLDLRLVVNDEVAVLDRLPQLPDHQRRQRVSRLHLNAVSGSAPEPRSGDRQRHVRPEQCELGVRAVFGQDEGPNTDLDRDAQVVQFEGPLESLPDARGGASGLLAGGDRRVEDAEQVAAHPSHQGAFAGQLAEANADRLQNCVGCSLSEGVVDLGEPFQVDQQDAGDLWICNAQQLVEAVDEVSAVCHTRDVVRVCESLEPLRLVLQLAHDADDPEQDQRHHQG
jgi:hypothetical protein